MEKKLLIASMSGGLDSATVVAHALKDGYYVQPISFNYGQKNKIELIAQAKLEEFFKNSYPDQMKDTVTIDTITPIQSFISTYQRMRDSGKMLEATGEEFYTPSRNLLFMTFCTVIGEIIAINEEFSEIAIGLGIHKHSSENYKKDYWDITPLFAEKLQELLSLNDSVSITVYSPFVNEFKSGIIARAIELNVPMYITWSCYDPVITSQATEYSDMVLNTYTPCGKCEACLERNSQAKTIGIYDINNYSIQQNEYYVVNR